MNENPSSDDWEIFETPTCSSDLHAWAIGPCSPESPASAFRASLPSLKMTVDVTMSRNLGLDVPWSVRGLECQII